MSYFHFDAKKVYYSEAGEGTPLVFLHGNTASSNMFYDISERYTADYKVILIDFLGHGQSDRLEQFPADLWYYEARQVIALLREKRYQQVLLIGSSGGALVAINVALEAPELVARVIADSFEGEYSLNEVTEYLEAERAASKSNPDSSMFYYYMHGEDWESIVDHDTAAAIKHNREIGRFFHRDLAELKADILLTGSKEDEFVTMIDPDFYDKTYRQMISKIGHGRIHLFETGGHPAMLTSQDEFYQVSREFLDE